MEEPVNIPALPPLRRGDGEVEPPRADGIAR